MLNPRLQIEVNFNRDISPQPMSQMDAALEAVRMIGLNQKEEVKKEGSAIRLSGRCSNGGIKCL